MKNILTLLLIFMVSISFSQEKDKALQKSNDYVFEGNILIDDDFISAEKEYRKAISEKPNNTPGSYNLGNAYYNTGHYNEALLRHIEAANLATTKTEKHNAYHNIGNTLMQQKQCKEAVEAFKNALRNNPTDEESRYNFALAKECAEQQGDGGGGDDDKEDEENKDEDKENEDKKDEGEDKDKKEGDDKEDEDGKPKDDKGDKKDGDPKNEKKEQQPQQGKLSPQQVKNLLEAMNNQEKKVQEKINAKKVKGERVKTEKDW
jgi:Ca-activated chloride channel family protein